MKHSISNLAAALLLAFSSVFGAIAIQPKNASASESFALSPMHDLVNLTPGETFESSFNIVNPGDNTSDFYYELSIEPFTEDGEQNITATANGHYSDMTEWIKLSKTEGVVAPNSSESVRYKIEVPENAAAGGQYASIVVGSKPDADAEEGFNIHEVFQAVYLIYAEVAGETVRKGTIDDVDVPSFLFSGNISGRSRITNEGNVHSQASYTLQVFPFFSKEESYTNEEDPKTIWIMPGNTTYKEISWDQTPKVGIFHVIYTVNFEGVEKKVDKYVIVCPIWLLIVIFALVFLILFKILYTGKGDKKEK